MGFAIDLKADPHVGAVRVFFDDIRIHPFNANMKSFVYDPINLRLMAELDENNYATFYEYDSTKSTAELKERLENHVVVRDYKLLQDFLRTYDDVYKHPNSLMLRVSRMRLAKNLMALTDACLILGRKKYVTFTYEPTTAGAILSDAKKIQDALTRP